MACHGLESDLAMPSTTLAVLTRNSNGAWPCSNLESASHENRPAPVEGSNGLVSSTQISVSVTTKSMTYAGSGMRDTIN